MSDLHLQFDSVFFEKTRLSILTLLYREEKLSFAALKELIGGTDGAVYTHLEKLRQAGYVDREKVLVSGAVSSQYTLTDLGRQTFRDYLKFLTDFVDKHA